MSSRITFNKKPRKEGAGFFTTDGKDVVIGKDWALQNEINEVKERTKSRACYKECRTCGCCANSRRDATYPFEYDANAKKMISCTSCERFRFHDCHNGFMRDAHGDAEPFTEDQTALIERSGGRPLI